MTKQEFLAASLLCGLKCELLDYKSDYVGEQYGTLNGLYPYANEIYFTFKSRDVAGKTMENIIPIIRPIDALTKECIQADYNDGKPFVPIVDLAKMIIDLPDHNPYMQYNSVSAELHTDNSIFIIHKDRFTLFERDEYRIITCPKQLQLFQQMLKWHFWPNMPENEEVVYVNENFNPYK